MSADAVAVVVCAPESVREIAAGTRKPPFAGFPREDVMPGQ